jgi:hypothetical protein
MERFLIDEALALLPESILRGRRASACTIGHPSEHPCTLRLTLVGDIDSLRLVVKRVSRIEYQTHSLLFRELPHLVPGLLATGKIKENDWLLVMEDSSTSEAEPVMDLTAMRSALRALAEVHCQFSNRKHRLRAAGLSTAGNNAREVGDQLGTVLDLLMTVKSLFDIALDEDRLRIAREVALTLDLETVPLLKPSNQTLVHGDFHFENILRAPTTGVRLTDWGSAAIQVPGWDLVMCSENEVEYYLSCTSRPDGFYRCLRAAVLYRMAEFIVTGTGLLFTSMERIADTISVCIERLVQTAAATEFRGGQGVRFKK